MKEKTKRVRAVDVLRPACYFSEVKLAAFESFNYEEFLRFFNPRDKETFFSHDQYERLKPSISKHAQDHFGELIHSDKNSDFLSVVGMFSYPNVDVISRNPYLQSEENYKKAQSNYKKAKEQNPEAVTFHPYKITEFLDSDIQTDHIYLSNIFAYEPYFDDDQGKTRTKEVIEEIKKAQGKLKPDGQISIYYLGDNPLPHVHFIAKLLNTRYPNEQMDAKIIKGEHNDKGDKYAVLLLSNPTDSQPTPLIP